MKFPSCLDKFVQIADRANIRVRECLDGKVAGDGQDDNRVEVVRKESNKIRARTSVRMEITHVALIPPTKV